MKSVLCDGHFHKEQAAYTFVEARVWPNGPVCPHCGGADRISKMQGKSTRIGAYKCYQCRKPFTVKIGTIFESSHVPLRHWLQAIFLLSSSKKGISSNQLARTLGCTLKTAWFLSHRIREAMRGVGLPPLGGAGKIIESDETYWGPKDVDTNPKMRARRRGKPGPGGKATGQPIQVRRSRSLPPLGCLGVSLSGRGFLAAHTREHRAADVREIQAMLAVRHEQAMRADEVGAEDHRVDAQRRGGDVAARALSVHAPEVGHDELGVADALVTAGAMETFCGWPT